MSEQTVTHVLKLPSGVELEASGESELRAEYGRHMAEAVRRGECPQHGTPLSMVPAKPGHAGGNCGQPMCLGYWHLDEEAGAASWELGMEPFGWDLGVIVGGQPVDLPWMAERPWAVPPA